jgi:dihydroneopterin aldolase
MKIYLKDMVFYGFHGVYPEERKLGQRYLVNLIVYTPDANDEHIKDLDDTVDYRKVYNKIQLIMEKEQFVLLEECANAIIECILDNFDRVIGVNVSIEKPSVPINASLSCVAVEMERFKK